MAGDTFFNLTSLYGIFCVYFAGGLVTTVAILWLWWTESTRNDVAQPGYYLKWTRTLGVVFLLWPAVVLMGMVFMTIMLLQKYRRN